MILRERTSDRFRTTTNDLDIENEVQRKEEPSFPSNSFHSDLFPINSTENHMDGSSNTIDLMDISKCIMGIEEGKNNFNEYNCLNEKITPDEYKIEAIKKYLAEPPNEYIDLNSLQSVKHEYFPYF